MDLAALYRDHLDRVTRDVHEALEIAAKAGESFGGVVLHAGSERLRHRDDQPFEFVTDPHFARFLPAEGSDHLLVIGRGEPPRLIRVVPEDYWYEPPRRPDHPWVDLLEHVDVADADTAVEGIGPRSSWAFVGDDLEIADALGIGERNVEPPALMAALDWARGAKSAYEVECIREAGRIAARGHAAVREGVTQGRSERELHLDYLGATGQLEGEAPYPNIIGWDEHAAVLHYARKDARRPDPGRVLLSAAGAAHLGYASDVTRTYARETVPARFVELLDGMEDLQRELVDGVRPGRSYVDLHHDAHLRIGRLLHATGLMKVEAEEGFELGLTLPFFPHGLGHHLGLQVHDVGGRQLDARGTVADPPAEHPFLRTTRPMEAGHVLTIEPGLYFIPMLLDPLRHDARAEHLDWKAIDALVPCGGIRIEDDVLVTADGGEDLTRPFIPGHRD